MSNTSDINELKQNVNNLTKQIEKLSIESNYCSKILPISHVPEDKKDTHANVCLQLDYNESKETIIFGNLPMPIDLFDLRVENVTREQKIACMKSGYSIGMQMLLTKDIFTDEDINNIYEQQCPKKAQISTYDTQKIINFIKTLDVKDFDETKNKNLFQIAYKYKDEAMNVITPNPISNIKQTLIDHRRKNPYVNFYISLK